MRPTASQAHDGGPNSCERAANAPESRLHFRAVAYLCQQYLASVNDNFEWVDGQFRDRVDDTKSAMAWAKTYTDLSDRFERRLKEIANQDNDTIMNTTRWGDKPYRWDRL